MRTNGRWLLLVALCIACLHGRTSAVIQVLSCTGVTCPSLTTCRILQSCSAETGQCSQETKCIPTASLPNDEMFGFGQACPATETLVVNVTDSGNTFLFCNNSTDICPLSTKCHLHQMTQLGVCCSSDPNAPTPPTGQQPSSTTQSPLPNVSTMFPTDLGSLGGQPYVPGGLESSSPLPSISSQAMDAVIGATSSPGTDTGASVTGPTFGSLPGDPFAAPSGAGVTAAPPLSLGGIANDTNAGSTGISGITGMVGDVSGFGGAGPSFGGLDTGMGSSGTSNTGLGGMFTGLNLGGFGGGSMGDGTVMNNPMASMGLTSTGGSTGGGMDLMSRFQSMLQGTGLGANNMFGGMQNMFGGLTGMPGIGVTPAPGLGTGSTVTTVSPGLTASTGQQNATLTATPATPTASSSSDWASTTGQVTPRPTVAPPAGTGTQVNKGGSATAGSFGGLGMQGMLGMLSKLGITGTVGTPGTGTAATAGSSPNNLNSMFNNLNFNTLLSSKPGTTAAGGSSTGISMGTGGGQVRPQSAGPAYNTGLNWAQSTSGTGSTGGSRVPTGTGLAGALGLGTQGVRPASGGLGSPATGGLGSQSTGGSGSQSTGGLGSQSRPTGGLGAPTSPGLSGGRGAGQTRPQPSVQQAKVGQCPPVRSYDGLGCVTRCNNDMQCAGTAKCCPTSCRTAVCRLPVKPGNCPRPNSFWNFFCWNTCSDDHHCAGSQKCCYDGSCFRCLSPAMYRPQSRYQQYQNQNLVTRNHNPYARNLNTNQNHLASRTPTMNANQQLLRQSPLTRGAAAVSQTQQLLRQNPLASRTASNTQSAQSPSFNQALLKQPQPVLAQSQPLLSKNQVPTPTQNLMSRSLIANPNPYTRTLSANSRQNQQAVFQNKLTSNQNQVYPNQNKQYQQLLQQQQNRQQTALPQWGNSFADMGMCPPYSGNVAGCRSNCQQDSQCGQGQKCCRAGGCAICLNPLPAPVCKTNCAFGATCSYNTCYIADRACRHTAQCLWGFGNNDYSRVQQSWMVPLMFSIFN